MTLLRLEAGQVDLACGRGGYGIELARRCGASLVGVDFAAVALDRARVLAAAAQVPADYVVGDLTATGLPNASADAIVCVDAMQFAEPYAAGPGECARVLRPGGRLVLTGWQALDPNGDIVPERLRRDIAAALHDAGFAGVLARSMPAWHELEWQYWQRAVAADPAGYAAVASLRDEGEHVLRWHDQERRVLAHGVRSS